jgi:hypothetical protein
VWDYKDLKNVPRKDGTKKLTGRRRPQADRPETDHFRPFHNFYAASVRKRKKNSLFMCILTKIVQAEEMAEKAIAMVVMLHFEMSGTMQTAIVSVCRIVVDMQR